MITNLSPYGQHAWHVVAYHRHMFLKPRRIERDHCSHVLLYLVELIDMALIYGDYEAATLFVDMLFDYRERCTDYRQEELSCYSSDERRDANGRTL